MPVHDWTRVKANIYHDFHNSWITHIKEELNEGVLPKGYFALGDQRIHATEPDVIAMRRKPVADSEDSGSVAVAVAPRLKMVTETRPARAKRRPRRIIVCREEDERIVAIIEITSPGNKDRKSNVRILAEKIAAYLQVGVHAVLIDLLPPTVRDPLGIHGAVWEYFGKKKYAPTPEEPLSLVSYRCNRGRAQAFIEPIAVGLILPSMPLYLTPSLKVGLPLETSYMEAFAGLPEHYRQVLQQAGPRV